MDDPAEGKKELKKGIGLTGLIAYGVGTILGAGIYALIGVAASLAGGQLWTSFLLAAFIALFTGFSYAELTTMFPLAGAEYHFVYRAFNRRFLAFLVGWALIITGAATAATVSLGFAGYFTSFVAFPIAVTAVLLIAVLSLVNFIGIRQSTVFNILFTLIEAGGLVFVIIAGFFLAPGTLPPFSPSSVGGVLQAAAFVFFAYLGFEQIANVAEESKNPKKYVPIAIGASVAITAVLYSGVAVAVLRLIEPDQLALSSAPLADAISRIFGERGAQAMSAVSLFATANTVLLTLVATSRVMFGIARARSLPQALAKLHSTRGTPWVSIVLLMLLSFSFLPLGGIGLIGSIGSWSALLAFAAVNASLIWLRFTRPCQERSFRVPGSIGKLPLIPVFGLMSTLFAAVQLGLTVAMAGIGVLLVGAIVYFVNEAATGSRAAKQQEEGVAAPKKDLSDN